MSLLHKALITIAAIVILGAILINLMPKPIDGDLQKIGNGQASVVFVYDLNLAASNPQALEFNEAQSSVGDRANLLVVRAGDPKSEEFRNRYQAESAELLFFDKEGSLIHRQSAVVRSEQLERMLFGELPKYSQ